MGRRADAACDFLHQKRTRHSRDRGDEEAGQAGLAWLVRLAPENATTLFTLVKETGLDKTEIVLNGDIPQKEPKVASSGSLKQQIKPVKKTVRSY
jgi:hypothetical protein